ncbi:MAG: acyl-CoA dehydrogenase [Deltaproteobacteria bacterium CG_4_8_14_3_um_filter_51_11]|nr:acyl-CoA dehydrogenase [bacterium]OIP37846.1 MAG: acyl-CoA dehydrogenase [Desulfobacteraceae bacterium CG2_30_51_40]PIP45466.1 MAG: acyl-CoA dehydrogenase [Deltaproteobacteria bacterium CG23_combo_of_CG06-09_8_20_14_all_51_20]PIX18094.1 MAG: acyl-CoA dehydrogenase [Deltaproteobacteria bacterium CG_4_8_14_3_um_filter_51_11]PJB33925.1 MAG: acyl-CoA dehydrogenase [Deltaproteobacteria bacterium CG_4_9_14_3_um_filter_51_14]
MEFSFSQEQAMFKDQVIRFAVKEIVPRVRDHELKGEFDFQSFRRLGEFGILGLHFPAEFGGSDADVVTTVLAGEALGEAGVDGGLTLSYGAHTFLCADTIFVHGTDAQRKKYLPKLTTGEWIGCMGLTEPNAGSDVASMTTRAERAGEAYILNGNKMFITNGPLADVAVIYAKTGKDLRHAGISAFIVEKGTPGFSAGKNLIKMGVRTSHTSELIFDNCMIPAENLLGVEGEGFLMALQTVEWDRSALMAPFVGGMTYVLKKSIAYAKQRHQFGRPIAEYQAIKHKLADMKIFIEAARTLIYRIAWCKDQGRPLNHLEAAVAKLFVGDWSLKPANDAVTLFGGYGYCHEYDVERTFRDSRLAPIGGGTSEIQKKIISKLI